MTSGHPVAGVSILLALLLAPALVVGSVVNDWLIVPGKRVGPITSKTTRLALAQIFGADNVIDMDVTVAAGTREVKRKSL